MSGLEPLSGTFALPGWTLIAAVVLIAILGSLAALRSGWLTTVGSFAQFAIVIGLLFLGWNFFDRMTARDAADERRAFAARLADLNKQGLAPASPLACLDALAGDALFDACEKSIFANPESVAASVTLMAERMTLLREATAHAATGDHSYEQAIDDLRRSIEQDRFGFVAQALAVRNQCTPTSCEALSLLKDSDRVSANLKDRTFETFVGRYVGAWMTRTPGQAVAAAPAQPAPGAAPAKQAAVTPATSAVNVDFPSAASIPPVSIMNAEPAPANPASTDPESKPAPRRPPPAAAAAPPRAAARNGNPAPSTSAQ